MQRLEKLENIATQYPGVERAFAMQAGREIRVMVEPTVVSDDDAVVLARDIARHIRSDLTYPGGITVTVVRESRVTEIAY